MESSEVNLMEKYRLACKGLNSTKPKSKAIESKKLTKSVELRAYKVSKYSTKQHTKIRPIIHRINDSQIIRSSYIPSSLQKTQSKLGNKTMTTQINLLGDPLVQSRIIDGKDIQKSIKNKYQISNSGVRNKAPLTASHYTCRRRKKDDEGLTKFNKTQIINYLTDIKKSVETKRNSFGQSKDSNKNRNTININRGSYVKPIVDK